MKKLLTVCFIALLTSCDHQIEFKSNTKAQIYDNNELVYESNCVAFASFEVNEQNTGVLSLKDGTLSTIEVRTFNMNNKSHSYVFKKTTCNQ